MSQLHTWFGPVATITGASLGVLLPRLAGTTGPSDRSMMSAAIRHHERREASITPSSQVDANV